MSRNPRRNQESSFFKQMRNMGVDARDPIEISLLPQYASEYETIIRDIEKAFQKKSIGIDIEQKSNLEFSIKIQNPDEFFNTKGAAEVSKIVDDVMKAMAQKLGLPTDSEVCEFRMSL